MAYNRPPLVFTGIYSRSYSYFKGVKVYKRSLNSDRFQTLISLFSTVLNLVLIPRPNAEHYIHADHKGVYRHILALVEDYKHNLRRALSSESGHCLQILQRLQHHAESYCPVANTHGRC